MFSLRWWVTWMWSSRFPCPGGSYPSIVVSIGTKHRVQSPLERWLSMISMNRPKMGSRPHEFLLQSGPITSWQIDRERIETVTDFIFLGSKITVDGDCSHEIKRCLALGRKAMTRQHIKKQIHYFLSKDSSSQSYGFSSSHVWMWESWAIKKAGH